MRRPLILFTLLLSGVCAFAQPGKKVQSVDTIRIWPKGAPNEFVAPELPEQIRSFVGNTYTEALLEVYPAPKPNGLCVIMCPGGAYLMQSQTYEGRDLHEWFNARGITYCMLQYRLPYNGHHDVPLSDLAEAVRIMRSRTLQYGISKIAVMGNSAGGHLASTLATHYDTVTRPDFQILMYPVITMEEGLTNTLSRDALLGKDPSQELVDLYSNEKHVTPDTPPAFIVLCADDPDVNTRNSTMYFDKLIENGVSATMHVYPTGGHGWGWKDSFTYKNQWVDELDKWLTTTVYPTLRTNPSDKSTYDWAGFGRYSSANKMEKKGVKVVFMGDSVTEFWAVEHPDFFKENGFVCRGISGQVTSQMLARFQRDVIDLHPEVVVISTGLNDIAQNNGVISIENVVGLYKSMVELAKTNGIKPVIGSLTPCARFYWRPDIKPAQSVIELNRQLKEYAKKAGIPFVDYHSKLAEKDGSFISDYAKDGCHPKLEGYVIMEETVLPVLKSMLK